MKRLADDASSQRDRGGTFIESVIAVALATIVVLPLLAAVRVSVISSTTAFDAAKVETALIDVADQVTGLPFSCDGYSLPGVVSTQYLLGGPLTGDAAWSGPAPTAKCDPADPTTHVQLVTLTITDPEFAITRTMEVVKTDG